MDRIIATNSVTPGTGDKAPTSGTVGQFTSGNSAVSPVVPATVLPAYAMNMLVEEIRTAVVSAGLTPSGADWTQLTQAIKALGIAQFSNTLTQRGAAGYIKLPDGTIIQTFPTPTIAMTSTTTVYSYTYTYPVAFSLFCAAIFASDGAGDGTTWGGFNLSASLTGGTGYGWTLNPNPAAVGFIVAIGR